MKISGNILNAKENTPVALVKIRLEVADKEVATFFTDEHGKYEYETDEDYIGEIISYVINKEGYEEKTFSTVVKKPDIYKKFLLREREVIADRKTIIKHGILFVLLVLILIVFSYNITPQFEAVLISGSDNDSFLLNDKYVFNYEISRSHSRPYNIPILSEFLFNSRQYITPVTWTLVENNEWLHVSRKTGQKATEYVTVTIYTPDFEFSPRPDNYTALVTLEDSCFDMPGFEDKPIKVTFRIPETKVNAPVLSAHVNLEPNPKIYTKNEINREVIEIVVNDVADSGTLYWVVRDNVTWIDFVNPDKDERGKITLSDYTDEDIQNPRFSINDSHLSRLSVGDTESGRITIRSNNDGKIKFYIDVTKVSKTEYEVHYKGAEEWYRPQLLENLENDFNISFSNLSY